MGYMTTNIYDSSVYGSLGGLQGGLGSLQQAQMAQYQQAGTTTTTNSVWMPYTNAIGMQVPIEGVAHNKMEVAIDPRNWLRQRVKEIEWRA